MSVDLVYPSVFQVVNHKDGKGVPPLVIAVKNGYLEICRLLLENGADVNAAEDKNKRTPVYHAIRNKYPDILDLLLRLVQDLIEMFSVKYLVNLFSCNIITIGVYSTGPAGQLYT